MATYEELRSLISDGEGDDLKKRIEVAIAVKAQELIDLPTPSTNQLAWASEALISPASKADQIMHYVLAANRAAAVSQIAGATDSAIQSNVDSAVDKLVA